MIFFAKKEKGNCFFSFGRFSRFLGAQPVIKVLTNSLKSAF